MDTHSDTKINPKGTYYQYIHPCNITANGYKYRFLNIWKNGVNYTSEPYNTLKECHEALKTIVEGTNEVKSTSSKRKRKAA